MPGNKFAQQMPVTSFTLVWIKITVQSAAYVGALVTSFTLVWIKIPF